MASDWGRCKPLLAPALTDGWTLEDVERLIEEGRAQLWEMPNSAAVTQVVEYPGGKVLRLWLAGGDLTELQIGLPLVEDWGRRNGCNAVEIEGRAGWQRALGYRRVAVVLRKELHDG